MILAMRLCFLGMLLSILGACAQQFIESEFTDVNLHIKWTDEEDMFNVAGALGHPRVPGLTAVTAWQDYNGVRDCFIYAPKPTSANDYYAVYVLGHEALHCTEGLFH